MTSSFVWGYGRIRLKVKFIRLKAIYYCKSSGASLPMLNCTRTAQSHLTSALILGKLEPLQRMNYGKKHRIEPTSQAVRFLRVLRNARLKGRICYWERSSLMRRGI